MPHHSDININIAKLNVRLLCSFPYTKQLCSDFLTEDTNADLTVSADTAKIKKEQENYGERSFSEGYCEGICLYREIAERLPEFDGFVFHGAAVEINGAGCIFAAHSGVGKTTHISLLLKSYPENVNIINGDKPIIRRIDGKWMLCSSPWAGKEGMKTNKMSPLKAIVLLERAQDSFIEKVSCEDHFDAILHQIYLPFDPNARMLTFDLVDALSKSIKFFRLGCNMDISAADTSYNALCEL